MGTSEDNQDYRSSHLQSGASYDSNLAGSPFDNYMAVWEKKHLQQILKATFPGGIGRYLDFACGTGRITEQIAPSVQQSTAVDISETMMAEEIGRAHV